MTYFLVDHLNHFCYRLYDIISIGSGANSHIRVDNIDNTNAFIYENLVMKNISFTRSIMVNELTVLPQQFIQLKQGDTITFGAHTFRLTKLVPYIRDPDARDDIDTSDVED